MDNKLTYLHDDDFIERIGFISVAIILLTNGANALRAAMPINDTMTLAITVGHWLIGTLMFIAALFPRRRPLAIWSILFALIFTVLSAAYTQSSNYSPLTYYSTDNVMISEYALDVLEHGGNPYNWDYTDMLRVNRDSLSFTPFMDTAPQHRVTYPALPTLTLLLFDRFGLGQGRVVGLTFYLLLLILLFAGVKRRYRPIVLLPLFALNEYTLSTLFGVGDIAWSALLVAMLLAWKRPTLRAILFGLAASYRQQPWFIAPFLLMLIWDERDTLRDRIRSWGVFVGIGILIFVGTNLPFVLASPSNWLQGTLEPLYAQFSVDGVGLNTIWRFGLIALDRNFFTVLQFSSYLLLLLLYWRHRRAWGAAFWIIPAIYFWLYYRSLTNYWSYWLPPLLIAILSDNTSSFRFATQSCDQDTNVRKRGSRPKSMAAIAGFLALGSLFVFRYSGAGSGIELSYSLPLRTFNWTDPLIAEMNIVVTNHRAQPIAPRFFAQRETGMAAYPWLILSGPEELAPGETGEYRISAEGLPRRMIRAAEGGEIALSDAGGQYAAYTTLNIPPQAMFADPDLIINPAMNYWSLEHNAPTGWQWSVDGQGTVAADDQKVDGHDAFSVTLTSGTASPQVMTARLSQRVTFPRDLAVWVYPPDASLDPTQSLYGFEVEDGDHCLWVLFGPSSRSGKLDDGTAYVYLDTPPGTWTRRVIDLAVLYNQFGWDLPSYTRREVNGLAFYARQTTLSLLFRSRERQRQWTIGAFEQQAPYSNSEAAIEYMIDHPDEYYFTAAEDYRYQGNLEQAADAYRQSLAYNDQNAIAYFQLGETLGELGGFDGQHYSPEALRQAIDAYQIAIDLGFSQVALAYKGMGWAQIVLHDYEGASRAFERAVQSPLLRGPDYGWDLANTYEGLAKAFAGQGDETEAAHYEALAQEVALSLANP